MESCDDSQSSFDDADMLDRSAAKPGLGVFDAGDAIADASDTSDEQSRYSGTDDELFSSASTDDEQSGCSNEDDEPDEDDDSKQPRERELAFDRRSRHQVGRRARSGADGFAPYLSWKLSCEPVHPHESDTRYIAPEIERIEHK